MQEEGLEWLSPNSPIPKIWQVSASEPKKILFITTFYDYSELCLKSEKCLNLIAPMTVK